jgi:hypothetical protein
VATEDAGSAVIGRVCWAYSPGAIRCDMPAGHPGDHAHTQTWTDEECATPEEMAVTALQGSSTAFGPVARRLPEEFWPDEDAADEPDPWDPDTAEVMKVTEGGTPIIRMPADAHPAMPEEGCGSCGHGKGVHREGSCDGPATIPDEPECYCENFI